MDQFLILQHFYVSYGLLQIKTSEKPAGSGSWLSPARDPVASMITL